MLRAYLNYGLIASVVVWAAMIGVMAYRLNESPTRWAFIGLMCAGGLTIAVMFKRIAELRDGVRSARGVLKQTGRYIFCQAGKYQQLYLTHPEGNIIELQSWSN